MINIIVIILGVKILVIEIIKWIREGREEGNLCDICV